MPLLAFTTSVAAEQRAAILCTALGVLLIAGGAFLSLVIASIPTWWFREPLAILAAILFVTTGAVAGFEGVSHARLAQNLQYLQAHQAAGPR